MKRWMGILIVAVLLLAGLAAWALVAWDPLRQLYTVTDHGVSLHGKMDSATFNLIMRGPQPGNMTHYAMVGVSGTASFRAIEFKLPEYSSPYLVLPRLGWFSGPAPDLGRLVRAGFDWLFSLIFQDARAACGAGGGACFWVGGSGNWSGASHWSATSGGATCGVSCVPTTTDTITLDANGGANPTVTFNVNPSITGSMTITGDAWTFSGAAATLSVGAVSMTGGTSLSDSLSSWTMTSLSITAGAIVWTASTTTYNVNGNVTLSGSTGVSVTTTTTWNVTGTWSDTFASTSLWKATGGSTNFTSTANATMTFEPSATLGANSEFNNCTFDTTLAAGTVAYTMATNPLKCGGTLTVQDTAASTSVTLDTSASNLSVTAGAITVAGKGIFNSRSSTVTSSGAFNASATTSIVTSAGGSWTVGGSWSNSSTSTSWSFLAGITFNAAASKTMTFCGTAGTTQCGGTSNPEFQGNVTFDQGTGGTGVTYTMGAALRAYGDSGGTACNPATTLTVQRTAGTGTVTFDTSSVSNFAYFVCATNITSTGAINGNASTITTFGSWTGGTFNFGTSTVSVGGNSAGAGCSINPPAAGVGTNSFYNLLWTAGNVCLVGGSGVGVANQLTCSASCNLNAGGAVFLNSSNSLPLSWSTTRIWASMTYNMSAAYTVATNGTYGGDVTITGSATGSLGAALNMDGALGTSTLTVSGTATLDTSASNFAVNLTSGTLASVVVASGGTLKLNASAVADAGNWNSSAGTLTAGTSTVTLSGTTKTVVTGSTGFATLSITGTYTEATGGMVVSTSLSVSGSLTTANQGISGGAAVTVSGTGFVSAGSSSVTVGSVTVSSTTAYLVLGSSLWSVSGAWSNSSTSASWSAGTSTITFTNPSGMTLSPNVGLPVTEFSSITFQSSNAVTAETFTAGGAFTISGTLTVAGQNATATTTFDLTASNFALNTNGITLSANGLMNGRASHLTVAGNWDVHLAASGAYTWTVPNLVELSATGTIWVTGSGLNFDSLTIDLGVTTSYTSVAGPPNGGVIVNGTLIINGTLRSTSGVNYYFEVRGSGTSVCTLPQLGASADVSQSGFFVVWGSFSPCLTVTIPGATFEMMQLSGNGAGFSFALGGNFSTPLCGVYNQCELIVSSLQPNVDASTCVLNTNNFTINLGGTLFVGDGAFPCTMNAGSSSITARGVSVNGTAIFNLQTSTLNAYPSTALDPVALYVQDSAVLNGGTATINNHGLLRMYASGTFNAQSATVNILADAGTCNLVTSGCPGDFKLLAGATVDLGSSNWFVAGVGSTDWSMEGGTLISTTNATITFNGAGVQSINAGSTKFPNVVVTATSGFTLVANASVLGNFTIASAGGYMSFGAFTLSISGSWSDVSTSASWSVGTGTASFIGSGTITAATALPTGEFPTVSIANGASYTLVNSLTMVTLTVDSAGILQVSGTGSSTTRASVWGFTLSTASGFMTLSAVDSFIVQANQVNVTFTLADSVTTAAVSITFSGMSLYSRVYFDGSPVAVMQPNQTVTINGPWSSHVISIRNTTVPDQNPAFVQISCSSSYAIMGAQLKCSVPGGIFGDPSTYIWYVNGRAVATGPSMSTYIFSPGFGDTVTVSLSYWSQQVAMVHLGLDTAPNLAVYLSIVVSAALVVAVVSRERQVWKRYRRTPSMEELEMMRQDREARMRGGGSR